MGVVENNKYSYIKISQLILTGSRGKSALLIPTTNLHYHGLRFYFKKMEQEQYFSVKTANSNNIEIFAENLLARFLAIHLDHRDIHEELEAMRHSDSEVAALYDKTEAAIILQITLMTICNLFYP